MERSETARCLEGLSDQIPDYLAGSLPLPDRMRLESHLPSCAPCQSELERYQELDEELSDAVPKMLEANETSEELLDSVDRLITDHPGPEQADQTHPADQARKADSVDPSQD